MKYLITLMLGVSIILTGPGGAGLFLLVSGQAVAGQYDDYKTDAKGISGTTLGEFKNSERQSENSAVDFIHGTEDSRSYDGFHDDADGGSDSSVKNTGAMFNAQLASNPDSPEGQVYEFMQGGYESDEYHNRDTYHEDAADALTLSDKDSYEGSQIYEDFMALQQEYEDGVVCHIELVDDEITEIRTTEEEHTCFYSDAPVYWPGQCEVTRDLTLPAVEAKKDVSFSKSKLNGLDKHTGSLTYPHDFSYHNEVQFTLEGAEHMTAWLDLNTTLPNDHWVLVNGNRIANSGKRSISDYLVEGENKITASCDLGVLLPTDQEVAPTGEGAAATACGENDTGVLMFGEFAWGDVGWARGSNRIWDGLNRAGSCPTGFTHVGYDWNMDRGMYRQGDVVRRCFKAYSTPQCKTIPADIRSYTDDPAKREFLYWYEKLRAVIHNPGPRAEDWNHPTHEEAKGKDNENIPLVDALLIGSKDISHHAFIPPLECSKGTRTWDGAINNIYGINGALCAISQDDVWEGPAFARSDTTFGWYTDEKSWFGKVRVISFTEVAVDIIDIFKDDDITTSVWENAACGKDGPCRIPSLEGALSLFDGWKHLPVNEVYPESTLNTATYSLGCGFETTSMELIIQHPAAIEEQDEEPPGCVAGQNQPAVFNDGSTVFGLDGFAFPYTDSPGPGSTESWQCTDHSNSRQFGQHIQRTATYASVSSALSPMFPGDLDDTSTICYRAEAPKYGLDISGLGPCGDGTYSCYGLDYQDPLALEIPEETFTEKVLGFFNPIPLAHAADYGDSLGNIAKRNECQAYEETDGCTEVDQICDAEDYLSGECKYWRKVFRCEKTEEVVVQPAEHRTVCTSPFPCMEESEDCTYEDESTDSFQEAAIALSVAEQANYDRDCLSDDPQSCIIFDGEASRCRSMVSSLGGDAILPDNNCCRAPTGGVSPAQYVQTMVLMAQNEYVQSMISQALAAGADYITSTGAWQSYAEPVVDAVSSWATTAYQNTVDWVGSLFQQQGKDLVAETAASSSGDAGASIGTSISASFNFAADAVMGAAKDMLGDELGSVLFDEVVRDETTGEVIGRVAQDGTVEIVTAEGQTVVYETAAQAAAEEGAVQGTAASAGLSSTVSFLMGAYTAYQITMLVNDMVTACKPDEYTVSYKLQTASCIDIRKDVCTSRSDLTGCLVKTDYYCCYFSPLARIIHEQTALTGQHPSGDINKEYYNRQCPGFLISDFAQLDFSQIDLSEWVELMMAAEFIPSSANDEHLDAFFDVDNTTKSVAEFLETEEDTQNAVERASSVMSASDGETENFRMTQRDQLIMSDLYTGTWRSCEYQHFFSKGHSIIGREEYTVYADGNERVITPCQADLDTPTLPHYYEDCEPMIDPETLESTPRKTVKFDDISGNTIVAEVCREMP